jgi:hypothetical protein
MWINWWISGEKIPKSVPIRVISGIPPSKADPSDLDLATILADQI